MIEQILEILLQNNVSEDVIDATMDTLSLGLMNKLSPEVKRQIKKEMEDLREEIAVPKA